MVDLLVLHPRYKLCYFEKLAWDPEWITTAEEIIKDEFKHSYSNYSDSKNCPNVWHFLIVCGIASYADQTEPKCWCMRESIT
jgi:hypothetical protein